MAEEKQNQNEVVSLGGWLIFLFILSIPIVGLIVLIVYAIGNNKNRNMVNLSRAALIYSIISCILISWVLIAFGAIVAQAFSNLGDEQMDTLKEQLIEMQKDLDKNDIKIEKLNKGLNIQLK